ncbi:type II secretory pathway pseudopilin PulG [Kribbella aluminosa]|uniref:Type II secretory pathway pseudopilin PulG n=1 Tax=Kribbella aluminosa TaxID=416017 RepID=A0ABS4UZ96_9ACTN|nr:hypothetical protein [Kribbella aluminosa]MBP2356859.1 type II secretory pathway pseudopilin PulG [Kribbella aluminosa]
MKWKIPGTRRTRALGAGAVVTTAALVAGGVAVANSAGAAETAQTSTRAASYRTQLIEMRTAGAKGYFYTSSQAEFLRAQKQGWKFTGQVPGYVATTAVRGTVPVYRLRTKSGSTYLLSISTAERNKLTSSGHWVYEGVVGRIPLAAAADRARIYRVSKNGIGWRVMRTAQASAYVKAGWHLDGFMGYVWTHK